MLIDVTTFALASDATEADLLAADQQLQNEISSSVGFVRRTTAKGDEGWLVITLWYDEASRAAALTRPTFADALERFEALADRAENRHYATLD